MISPIRQDEKLVKSVLLYISIFLNITNRFLTKKSTLLYQKLLEFYFAENSNKFAVSTTTLAKELNYQLPSIREGFKELKRCKFVTYKPSCSKGVIKVELNLSFINDNKIKLKKLKFTNV